MKLHPRVLICQFAHNELDGAVSDVIAKHHLTYGELFSILSQIQATWSRYAIRDERHPDDPEKHGGEE